MQKEALKTEVHSISLKDKFIAHFFYWLDFLIMIVKVRRTFYNSTSLLSDILNNRYPIYATLKDGRKIKLKTLRAIYLISNIQRAKKIEYVEDDIVTLELQEFPDKKIEIHGGLNNGDIVSTFLKKDYKELPVENRFVVDIGSNIGDTPLFFALSGARKIIGVEPFLGNFEYAKKNVEINKYSDKIELLLSGCAGRSGFITIDPDCECNVGSKLRNAQMGIEIPLFTLDDIITQFKLPSNSILKIDCEGCEHEIIDSASIKTLQKFSHIQIEFHYSYKKIKEKLERCGFEVKITKLRATDIIHYILSHCKSKKQQWPEPQIEYLGYIFATTKSNT